MLNIKNFKVSVGKKEILTDFNFNFKKGKVYALMGPNGSGKSTLALAAAGHPQYRLGKDSKIVFKGKNIAKLAPDKIAKLGLFLSFQSPLAFSGISVFQLLKSALGPKTETVALKKKMEIAAKKLKIKQDLLERSLNQDFSGGERKKMEVLQAVLLEPDFLIFDEIDTGIDIDSLRTIALSLKQLKEQGKTMVLITHYSRVLKLIRPDKVLVLSEGKLVRTGNYQLADQIEKRGYAKI